MSKGILRQSLQWTEGRPLGACSGQRGDPLGACSGQRGDPPAVDGKERAVVLLWVEREWEQWIGFRMKGVQSHRSTVWKAGAVELQAVGRRGVWAPRPREGPGVLWAPLGVFVAAWRIGASLCWTVSRGEVQGQWWRTACVGLQRPHFWYSALE